MCLKDAEEAGMKESRTSKRPDIVRQLREQLQPTKTSKYNQWVLVSSKMNNQWETFWWNPLLKFYWENLQHSLRTTRKQWLTIPSALSMTGISSSLSWLWSRPRSACWDLSIRSPVWSIITVFSTVSMATLPFHFCYHFVSHLVSWPHISPVPIKHMKTIWMKTWNLLVWTLLQ